MRRQLLQLQAWAKDELEAQGRLLDRLRALEEAVRAGATEEVRRSGEALERELPDGAGRERRRAQVIGELARILGVPARALTLSSIAVRAGAAGQDVTALEELRDGLRERVAAVVRTGRRITALARYHRELTSEVMGIIAASPEEGDRRPRDGALVDAEA